LREHEILVEDDFFMVYIQTQESPNVPGLATDESGQYAERSYQYVRGAWSQTFEEQGNYMIRARIDVALEDPTIATPVNELITNEEEITVEGSASRDTDLTILVNGDETASTTADENGEYTVNIELREGQNEIQAVTYLDDIDAAYSEEITVTLDTVSPELTISSPAEGDLLN